MKPLIKSISGSVHDTGFGGYPYKVIVNIELDATEFNTFKRKSKGDLGSLVLDVNNMVYAINRNIPAYHPSIDSKGGSRSKNGVKSMQFVYFFSDHSKAESLGFKVLKFKNGDCYPDSFQHVNIFKVGA